MASCSDCKNQDCLTYKNMRAVATCPPFEFGVLRGILERMEELAEYCTQYKPEDAEEKDD